MMSSKQNPKQPNHTNDGLLSEIWNALREEESLRSQDLGGLSIKVEFGEVYLDGYLIEENQPLVESIIRFVVGVVEIHNRLRTDDGILADIWAALWQEDAIRSLDLGSLSIEVKGGEVYLYGCLAQENNLLQIESIAQSVVGVVAVHNFLVFDRDLIIQVAQALATDERTRPYILPVDAFHGWIHIGGEVPSRELQQVAQEVVGEVAGVRGVIALPRVTGESPDMPQLAVQPCIGAVVYGGNQEEGVVTQVVIQPEDRLVTHIVVRSNEVKDGNLVARVTVIPLDARDLVKNESIILQRHGPSLDAFPVLDPDEYPLAEYTWKAPYPYTAGEVRWSLREILDTGTQPVSRPEIKPGAEVEQVSRQVMAQASPRAVSA